jgi:hypothetical protein
VCVYVLFTDVGKLTYLEDMSEHWAYANLPADEHETEPNAAVSGEVADASSLNPVHVHVHVPVPGADEAESSNNSTDRRGVSHSAVGTVSAEAAGVSIPLTEPEEVAEVVETTSLDHELLKKYQVIA